MKISLRSVAYGAVIAAMYTALTLIFAPISFGAVQFRISEMLTVLPFFAPTAIYGLFIGCVISNIFGGNGIYDILFGSLATLAAAYATYRIKAKILAPAPPVIINAIVIGVMLGLVYKLDIPLSILTVGLGQLVVLYGLGLPLIYLIEPRQDALFKGILSKYRR
jgi:uncharacterized membrane protein